MKRSSRARLGATAAVCALSIALITGCGGGSDDSDASESSNKPSSSPAKTAETAKTLTSAELKKLIVTKADLEGYDVDSADTGGRFAESKDEVTVADARCEPIAYVLTGFAPGEESAFVSRMASPAAQVITSKPEAESTDPLEDALGATMTIVSLSSYEGDGAERTMRALGDAVAGCTGGFTASAKGQDTEKFTKVSTEKSAATSGESMAFAVTGATEGGGEPTVHAQVVRHGSTIATYYSINLAALGGGKQTKYSVPAAIVKAQAAKLA
ncbi:hypothetical protein ACFYRY_15870 [Streptomyces sp. NPDC005263]|uniref:hypothetical protein n=1 Tax=Streptomyces sp. NPDC005263 TaxID=3364711 RepID=UPI003697E0BC